MHNLYRNKWSNIILHKDNFAQEAPPEPWAIEFRNEALDALTLNTVSRIPSALMHVSRKLILFL